MSESTQQLVLWLIPLSPLVAAVVTAALGPKILGERSHWPCWIGLAVSTVCSLLLLFVIGPQHFDAHSAPVATGFQWIEVGGMNVAVTLRADAMTSIMLAMVTSVSFLVAVFAAGYMHGDPGYARFFAAVSLFVFSMCMLVLAANFLLLFVFWEGVGLCSYLLIGFWFRKPSAAAAAVKAFVVNRIGDFGFLLGIFLIWTTFGSLDFADVLDNEARLIEMTTATPGVITAICLLLLLGAMGKSAQFPLHVWLPDAMEGPTPVSALIHAATMVTAGVYMVARATPLFVHAPTVLLVVSGVGAVTALLSALIGLSQFDLKRVLAYSTVSQLGFMFMALGAGAAGREVAAFAATAAMFHLFTHAFFKALLFLAAGSVMHSMGDVIDMRRFGGLRRVLPVTHWTFLCGAAALAGVPLLAGFWSKDDILAALHTAAENETHRTFFYVIFGVAAFTALLTAFYTFRAYFMTFWGDEKFPKEAGHHPHDAPPVMAWPLMILAVCAVFIGVAVGPTQWFAKYLHHTSGLGEGHEHAFHFGLMAVSAGIAVAGIGLAWLFYVRSPKLPGQIAATLGPLYRLSLNKFYLDEIFGAVLVTPMRTLASVSYWFDRTIIDPTVDLIGRIPQGVSLAPRTIHNGLVPSYALVMWTGLVLCVLFALGVFS
jgi:NADH-quinone oxidoreductase subunit L